MLNTNYTGKILGIEDAIVTDLRETDESIHLDMEMPRKSHICPNCGRSTDKIHDYRIQVIKDIPLRKKKMYFNLRKRRYKCSECGKQFYENVPFVAKYYHVTKSLIYSVIQSFRECRAMKGIAKEHNISVTSVARYFDTVSFGKPKLPKYIAIDEYGGNAGNEKFQSILTNPKKRKMLDLMPSRKSEDLAEYFNQFKDKNNVELVVMDMSNLFRSVVKSSFPKAKIIADKYHVIWTVDFAFENVRKNEQNKFSKEYRKIFKRSKSLLRKRMDKLTPEEASEIAVMLNTSERLGKAYYLKEEFRKIFELKTRAEAADALQEWLLKMHFENIEEFKSCDTTFLNWEDEILNIFEYGLINAYTEESNNKTKVLKRISYGVKNKVYLCCKKYLNEIDITCRN